MATRVRRRKPGRPSSDKELRAAEASVLEMVAARRPLGETLDTLARLFEAQADGMLASILLVEGGRVRHVSAPHLPASWVTVVDGEPIGPDRGSCGTAAWLKQPVIATNIATDPRWARYREAALGEGLRACWSVPILDGNQTVLGTFALYYAKPRQPTARLLALAHHASHLATIAIQHHRVERALIENEAHLRLIYDHVADVLFELTVEREGYRFASLNPAFAAATGIPADQVLGRLVQEVIPEPSRSLVLAKYDEAIRTRRTVRWEETTQYPTGARQGDVAVTPVFDEHGAPRYLIGSVHDITDRRRMEMEVRQLQKLEAMGRLSGGIAHDFNNILAVIVGVGQMLLEQLDDPDLRGQVGEIVEAAERGAGLTRQFLAFGRKQILQPQVIDLGEVIRQLEPMLRRLIPPGLALRTTYPPDPWHVRADPGRMEQVVINLVTNARDAMPQGGSVTIAITHSEMDDAWAEAHPGMHRGPHVRLSVADTGQGMGEETMRRIFEPFFTTKEPGKGTGLGLPTVYGIVKQSGGEVVVDTALGRGTTFSVYLPRTEKAADHPSDHPVRRSLGRGLAGVRVLVVEDEAGLRRTIERILKRLGCEVAVVASGDDALTAITAGQVAPELLLTDTYMPGLSGDALVKRLRALHPDLKFLRMSGVASGGDAPEGAVEPRGTFLQKPFTIDELSTAMRQVLDAE